jgi:hypothetical protein
MNHDLPSLLRVPFVGFLGALALAGTLGGSLLTGACGGDDEAPAGPGPIPIEALRSEHEVATCDFEVRCGLMPDKETCLRVDRAEHGLVQNVANVVFDRLSYDPAAGRACVEAIRARSCHTLLADQRALEAACTGMFRGTVAAGGPCLVNEECTGESFCDRSMCGEQCCLGACAPEPAPVALSGSCDEETPCVDEAYCEVEGGDGGGGGFPSGSCQPRNENGQACEFAGACKDGQRCAEGKCYILSREGEACNPTLDTACLSFNNWCDPAASMCVKLPGAGEACATNDRCQGWAYCDAGTCRARPVEDQPCPVDGPQCLGDLRCEMDVCLAPPDQTVCVLNEDG